MYIYIIFQSCFLTSIEWRGKKKGDREERETETALTMKHLSKRAERHLLRCMGRLLMQVALLLCYPELPLVTGKENNLFPAGTTLHKCPLLSHRYLLHFFPHCYAILSTFIITFFSFLMFSLLASPPPPLINVFMAFALLQTPCTNRCLR